jgi:uncharacterized membrane protein YqgA involved in biofilm formation
MIGVLVNVLAIIVGGSIGLLLKKGLNDRIKKVVMQAVGLAVVIIGVSSAILTENILLLVLSLVSGGIIGALLQIDRNLEKLGQSIESKFDSKQGGFAKGFVLATLIYCVGAMAIIGSIEAGVDGDNTTLYIKSILDGVTAIIFTATLGYGVIFSSIPVLLYQGTIVLLGIQAQKFLSEDMIREMSAVGGVLILGIGLGLLEIKKIQLGDLLPAIFIPVAYYLVIGLF